MKKLTAFFLCLTLLLPLAACGSPPAGESSSGEGEAAGTSLFDLPEDAEVSYEDVKEPFTLDSADAQAFLEKLNAFRYGETWEYTPMVPDPTPHKITAGDQVWEVAIVDNNTLLWEDTCYRSAQGGWLPPRLRQRITGQEESSSPEELAAQLPSLEGEPVFTRDPKTVTGAQIRDEDYPDAPRTLEGEALKNLVTHLAATRYSQKEEPNEAQAPYSVNLTFQDGTQSGWIGLCHLFIVFPDGSNYWNYENPYLVGIDDVWLFDLMYPEADG